MLSFLLNSFFLPILIVTSPVQVTGHTYTYTEGATCIVRQAGVTQTVTSDSDLWCTYHLTPRQPFTVNVYETSDDPAMPGAAWGFACQAADVSEEYPQAIYGPGCKRS